MLKGIITAYLSLVYNIGCGPAMGLTLWPISVWFTFVLWTRSRWLLKENIEIGLEVVRLSAAKGHASYSVKVAEIAVDSLRGLIAKKGSNEAEADETVKALSDDLVRAINRLHKKNQTNILTEVIDTHIAKFDRALHEGSKKAKNLASAAMVILSSCVKQHDDSEYALNYLAERFVRCLQASKMRQDRLVTGIVNEEVMKLNHLAGKGAEKQAKFLLLAILALLRTSHRPYLVEPLRAISSATVDALSRMTDDGHHSILDNLLKDSADTIYTALRTKEFEAKHISGAIQSLMIAAFGRNADGLIEKLSVSWVDVWNRVAEIGHDVETKNKFQLLIAEREDAIYLGVENESHKSASSWDVSFELLLTAMKRGKEDVRDGLSHSIISGLARAKKERGDGSVRSLICGNALAFSQACRQGDIRRAKAVSNTCIQLIRTAMSEREDWLVKDLSAVWVAELDMISINGTGVSLDGMLYDVLTKPFTDMIRGGDKSKAQKQSNVGIELLLAAIRGRKPSSISSLSKSWVVSLINAKREEKLCPISELISARTCRFTDTIIYCDARESEAHGMAMIELRLAAQDVEGSRLAKDLETSFVEGLGKAVELQAGIKASQMLHQIRLNYLEKVVNSGTTQDVQKWFGMIRSIASHARGQNPAVYKILREERNWGVYILG
ncbi:hypothetical protein BO94DRAFT_542133 [Aspergillus sclerotioniger CBS 115572]|uniref:Uncharacterized protein n=1 Tax=Aspergillus sclerotioniger CBS 115572 TaxID=1450535 RepID=A0A317XCJ8_9EURO|nr:hypothetical protein BO94DRAFT_542133 [Aspergillus sclerotioniger CBS 115572]PWY96055.1 hypothetical protein BO94DRAFT_542133 [Aspergillus sclerotioniger CBS 115572]